jgi:hypothetical protein
VRAVPLGGTLARGRVAWVSARRYDLVMAHRWSVLEGRNRSGSAHGPYAKTNARDADGRRVTILMHDLIMGCAGIDHRNGYGLDNTDPNLRKATDAENGRNRGPSLGATSAYKGVCWSSRHKRWRAKITISKDRPRELGLFVVEVDAALAYDAAAAEEFGEFARLNFPVGGHPWLSG